MTAAMAMAATAVVVLVAAFYTTAFVNESRFERPWSSAFAVVLFATAAGLFIGAAWTSYLT